MINYTSFLRILLSPSVAVNERQKGGRERWFQGGRGRAREERNREREREGERMRELAGRGIVTRSLNLVVDCR